jgi:prolyl oligopeptidase
MKAPTCILSSIVALWFSTTPSVSSFVLAADPAADLQQLLDDHWEWTLHESPTFASSLGDLRYNDRWPDASRMAIERSHQEEKAFLRRLDMIEAAQLSPPDRLNYDLFRKKLVTSVEAFRFGGHLMPVNQMGGIQDENTTADALRFDTRKDYEDWLARLRGLPEYIRQTITLLREGAAQGLLPPKIIMQRVPAQVQKQLVDDLEKSPFFKPFTKFPSEISDDDRTKLVDAARTAIADGIIPAYRELQKYLEDEYLPACYDEIGAWRLPHGDEFYSFQASRITTTNLSPDEIHEIGLAEVQRIRTEMESIIREVGFTGTFAEFLTMLRTDRRFYYESPVELMAAYRDVCKRIDPELPRLFKHLPSIPYDIQPIPELTAPDVTTAYYRPPAADGSRAGTYFVNLYRPEMRPKYEIEALSLHEAVPGHHLQIALAIELGELPKFRRFGGFTAYVEGWGLYSERLGSDLGLYRDPYSHFGQLTYEMWRAIRLVVDTGMHRKHWTRKQAIDLFRNNAPKSELDIINEIDRYIAWPGQALAYKIGELKIRELRKRAEEKLGDRFDIREFHDVVLRHGAVPLDMLERIVDEWLAKTG